MDIAIVAMDCLLPGADSAEAWIAASRAGTPATGPVPAGRWPMEPAGVLDAEVAATDRTPTLNGGFVDPVVVDGVDPALDPLVHQVVRTVRAVAAGLPTERTDLLLANLSLPTTGMVRAASGPYRALLERLGADTAWLDGGHPDDLQHGALPALVAAEDLGLGGHVAALDAACASGLYAVQLACDRLAAGLCDAAIAAAAQRADSSFLFLGFNQLRALSTEGVARPFDTEASGLLVGEGAAAVALKRLADAQRDGDVIHAVIRGGGLGNDGRKGNLLAPSATGQSRALSAAYARANIAPAEVGYTECHATGTQLGDKTELQSLASLHAGRTTPLRVSSTKGQIGHTITVAGLAGLIRAAGAVRDGFVPPTVGCRKPWAIDGVDLEVLREAATWEDDARIAAVSAFGFGGTNAHVLLSNQPSGDEAATHDVSAALHVHGLGARLASERTTAASLRALEDGPWLRPAPASVARGLSRPDGAYLDAVELDAVARRIPPSEAAQLLPQQLALLEAAADALASVDVDPTRTACVVGMSVDPQIAEHTHRWLVPEDARAGVVQPLTSARVQGVLPNFAANRVSAVFDLQGPSYTVSAGALSLHAALEHAHRLLASGAADAVVVGAVDLPGQLAHDLATPAEGAVALVVTADADGALLSLDALRHEAGASDVPHRVRLGHMGAADGALALLDALIHGRDEVVVSERSRTARLTLTPGPWREHLADTRPERRVSIPHDLGPAVVSAWLGAWDAATVPLPNPQVRSDPAAAELDAGEPRASVPLHWEVRPAAPIRVRPPASAPVASKPAARPPAASRPVPPAPAAPRPTLAMPSTAAPSSLAASPVAEELRHLASLAQGVAATTAATAQAHHQFLQQQQALTARLGQLGELLAKVDPSAVAALPAPLAPRPAAPRAVAPPTAPRPAPRPVAQPVPTPPVPTANAPVIDRAGLEHLAEGTLSQVLGAAYADLDDISPRVRLPMGELLLVSRVTQVDGERGELGPAHMKTEYDLPTDASWVHQGKPPPCVVVESGQADLLLCAILGTDALTQGKALYRLLDCDLTFHGDRPPVGETLCHDIRIKNWARYGETILFYFEYDCTAKSDGRPVLTMREGCAGFFTPKSLSVPQGVDPTPKEHPTAQPLVPVLPGAPDHLDDAAVAALSAGRASEAFGPSFAPADGAELRLMSGKWRLIHRVEALALRGGPHGLGRVVAHQDLRDDDWFNEVHFKDDPCMPGTLMFDGCTQALSIWMLAHGFAAEWSDATFEPVADVTTRLRCRGQVVPGHSKLTYDVRPTRAGIDPTPWVVADVILLVDDTPVVIATDVSLRLSGERTALPAPTTFNEVQHLEFSVGDPSRAFGPNWTQHDNGPRTPRMPGPPLLMLSRAERIDAPKEQLTAPASTDMAYDVPEDAWWWEADPQAAMPLAILLEIALQPCGWLTAWQGAALGKTDLYFRNLGGNAVWHRPVFRDAGTLHTTARLVSVSSSGGMTLVFFTMETRCDGELVLSGDTHFGYFTKQALAEQKGLGLPDEARRTELREQHATDIAVTAPRDDLRMLDRITARSPDFVAASKAVDASEWFFTAHFHQDPVMPGSLGLEGLAQLARWELEQRVGAPEGTVEPVASGAELSWRYRGQVHTHREALQYEIDVLDQTDDSLTANGVVRADGLAIYEMKGLSVRFAPERVIPPAPVATRPTPRAALLDQFQVEGNVGSGILRLDPALHPWLADHAPTLVIPALPMAFAAEIAAEAALLLHPGATVIGLPQVRAEQWVHTADGPVDLLITAISEGEHVAVTLALHHDNSRFPRLSGPKVHMRAIVALGASYPPAPPAPEPLSAAQPVDLSAADYYAGGLTFHGPALQALTAFHERGSNGITATFTTKDDAELLPPDSPAFALDPLLLDTATHPMFSGSPELWSDAIAPGRLAYPVACDNLQLHGPRPSGEVHCRLTLVDATPESLCFDVLLTGANGPWASFRWTEALVPGGPVLGQDERAIAHFAKAGEPWEVRVGRATNTGWTVHRDDLVEPIDGTLVRLLGQPPEVDAWRNAADRDVFAVALIAAKEAVRSHLRTSLGRDVHPRSLRLVRTRDDRFVVAHAAGLTAQEFIDHLAATRFIVDIDAGASAATAMVRAV